MRLEEKKERRKQQKRKAKKTSKKISNQAIGKAVVIKKAEDNTRDKETGKEERINKTRTK